MYIERYCKSPPWLLVVLLTAFSAAEVNAQAKFFGLGLLPGALHSEAYGISADGTTVVGRTQLGAISVPARWTLNTGWQTLDFLPGGNQGVALGVSGDGSIIVGNSRTATYTAATRWTSTGGVEDLGNLPSGISQVASSLSTSSDGNVIVGYATTLNGREAFRWTESDGMVGLRHLGDDLSSEAWGVSADGSVVVGRSSDVVSSGNTEAFRWTADTGMVGLGQLQSDGFGSTAYGISGDGNVIFGSARRPGIHLEGFRWTADGGMVGIGDLSGGLHRSEMVDANYDGSIMVGQGRNANGNRGVIWDETRGLRTVMSFAEDELGLDIGDWLLGYATGISDDGTRIVGLGRNPDGQAEAWMLVIPEPNTSLLLLAGFAVGSLRRRRRN